MYDFAVNTLLENFQQKTISYQVHQNVEGIEIEDQAFTVFTNNIQNVSANSQILIDVYYSQYSLQNKQAEIYVDAFLGGEIV
jgi:hypothetical protein